MRKLDEYIAAHIGGPIQLAGLARQAAISPFHFAKRFKATTGAAPYEYVVARRMDCAAWRCCEAGPIRWQ